MENISNLDVYNSIGKGIQITTARKHDSPRDIVNKIQRIEDQGDKCYRELALIKLPWNVAAWAALTDAIRLVEASVPTELYGSRHHINVATNASRIAAQTYKFVRQYGREQTLDFSGLQWSSKLAAHTRHAFEVAKGYFTFCTTFPYWHADKYAAEAIGDSVVRFVSQASPIGRRIIAYQQGIRPRNSLKKKDTGMDSTPALMALYGRSLDSARYTSKSGVIFSNVRDLQHALYEVQEKRTLAMMRRYPDIRIGEYSLEDFRKFYSGLNAIGSAHEFLCYLWTQGHGLPLDSLLLLEHRYHWIALLSDLTQLTRDQVHAMLRDVTFGRVSAADFHLLPLVPLNVMGAVLALAPFCSLSANWEENVLTCLSRRDSDLYSSHSLTKEEEMRRPLIALTEGTRLITGGHKLPNPLPDIDLVVQDLNARILVLCELKWSRKPNGYKGREDRDREVLKGFTQIQSIRSFVEANPRYLVERGYIPWDLSQFEHVHYCVVARDHLVEPPAGAVPLYSYDAFATELRERRNTLISLKSLEQLEWLPIEGIDFWVEFERHYAGDVAVESEIYYPAGVPLIAR